MFLYMPSLSFAECTNLPNTSSIYIPLACAFDDILGTWYPVSRLVWESGDIAIRDREIVFLKEKRRIPIIVLSRSHPIIIEREGMYSWLEINASTFQNTTSLCFNDYAEVKDYNELKDAESRASKAAAVYCYGRTP
jgi:hypothetical protein